jgi:hypothetical protein
LNKAVIAAVALPDVQERFRRDGFLAQPMNPEEFTNFHCCGKCQVENRH